MNVGILTLHYGFNEGAVLQAMALARLLDNVISGAHAEVVDHRYPGKQAVYGGPNSPRERAIAQAVENWLPLSEVSFHSAESRTTFDYCRRNYDALVVGSDVVWSLRYTGRLRRWLGRGIFPRQKDAFFPAFPNVYWPPPEASRLRIAYAASCGNLWWKEIPRTHRRQMARRLSGFAAIGIRDERTRTFIRALSTDLYERAKIVPDPTIAFNLLGAFDGSTALAKLASAGYVPGQAHALLIMKETPLSVEVARHLRTRGWRLFATGSHGGLADVDLALLGLSPIEWAWLPREFAVCVTERMHASIFCLLNHTPVLALDMNRRLPGTPTKLQELFLGTGLSEAYVHQHDTDEARVDRWLQTGLNMQVNWGKVDAILDSWRVGARQFLSESLA